MAHSGETHNGLLNLPILFVPVWQSGFIIRKIYAENFRVLFEPKGRIATSYFFSSLFMARKFMQCEPNPWGTAYSFYAADMMKKRFAVINADDFYGRQAFQKAYDFSNNRS